ncbi:MAG TPA: response regulator transcription factor [Azoarcus taiwanensis]|nr:response regulator transcription factor [Azoarcus taiwanensis]
MKLLIVDDSSAVYRRLIDLLGGVENFTALSVARSLEEVTARCCALRPDAVVLDIDLPDGEGLQAVALIKSECPGASVFVFSNHLECRPRAMASGVDAFFDKSMEFEALVSQLLKLSADSAARDIAAGNGGQQ